VQVQQEREEKFDVKRGWVLPDMSGLVPDSGSVVNEVRHLTSVYFDTADRGLLDLGVTLRRRVGGGETGWQLKVPAGSARTELHSGSRRLTPPKELSEAVAGLQGGKDLVQLATISTTRTASRVVDAAGVSLFEIADDVVESSTLDDPESSRRWREIEIELGPAAGRKTLAKVASWLRSEGAKASNNSNKLERALGVDARQAKRSGIGGKGSKEGTVGELVADYVAEQCAVIACNDVALRAGARVVHKTRVAVRRLRSTLRIFRDVFHPEQSSALDAELRWYAELLGAVRDCGVLAARLKDHIAQLPAQYVLGPVSSYIEETLALDRQTAAAALSEGMSSDRYMQLLGTVRIWRTSPPLTEAGEAKAAEAWNDVRKARRKAKKRLEQADGDAEKLHRARKAMKRLRYAAELTKPAHHKSARVARNAKRLQTRLGEHQDAVVSAGFLTRLGASAGSRVGHSGFTYGVLLASELARARSIRRAVTA
jgi:CHAD domain-containing protein